MRQRMGVLRALFAAGAIEIEEVRVHVMAWLAHARHGQTRGWLEAELARLSFAREDE